MIEDFDIVDQFWTSLNTVESGDDMRVEKILHSEIALESLVVEEVKIVLYAFSISWLGKRKVLIISELTEVFANYIFKVI
jgi:hypothetical protein